jgi:tRNA (guanine-N7-)-methyltransferase
MRRKGKKQIEVRSLDNVLWGETNTVRDILKSRFGEKQLFTLELGCGNGEYTVSLAKNNPDKIFAGIDVKGSRIWTGAKFAFENKIENCFFIISRIDRLNLIFSPETVEEIWIPFPNPFEMRRSAKQRLVHKRFIDVYKKICIPGANIHLKTDDVSLYDYTLKVVVDENLNLICFTDNLYNSQHYKGELTITTKFEQQHINQGKTIKYVHFAI